MTAVMFSEIHNTLIVSTTEIDRDALWDTLKDIVAHANNNGGNAAGCSAILHALQPTRNATVELDVVLSRTMLQWARKEARRYVTVRTAFDRAATTGHFVENHIVTLFNNAGLDDEGREI